MSSSGGTAPAPPLPSAAAAAAAAPQSSGAAATATTAALASSSASKKKAAPGGGGGAPKPKKKKPSTASAGAAAGGDGGAPGGAGAGGGGSATKSKSGASTGASRKKKPSSAGGASGGGGGGGGNSATSKANTAASRQALAQEAKKAQHDLQRHKALRAAQQSDPLWYTMEDVVVLPTLHESNAMVGKTSVLPEQVQVVETALRQTGLKLSDLTPQAMACVLEQARRYALELITDAQDYAHASHPTQDSSKADLLLAADLRADHPVAVSTQLPKLNLVAAQINRAPLPPIPSQCYSGILLPPPEHQLTSRMYDAVYSSQVSRRMVQETPHLGRLSGSAGGTAAPLPSSSKPLDATTDVPPSKAKSGGETVGAGSSYGTSRGRQIPIKLKVDDTKTTASSTNVPAATVAASTTTHPATTTAAAVPTPGTSGDDVTMTDA